MEVGDVLVEFDPYTWIDCRGLIVAVVVLD